MDIHVRRIVPEMLSRGSLLYLKTRVSLARSSTVENYEYGFFWYLYQDGNIQLEVKLAQATPLLSEKQARANLSLETARTWKIVNPAVLNAVGEPVGYKFMPGDNCFPMASKEAWWRKRAGFVNQHVWVTPYRDDENYAAGDYPNQSRGGDGLISWTEQDRPIANTDVVFWYTFGHTHIPRPEDYPVMPTAYIGFLLKPNGFFRQNPANDVPPSQKKAVTKNCCR